MAVRFVLSAVVVVGATGFAAGVSASGARPPRLEPGVAFVRFTAHSGHPRIYTVAPSGGRPRLLRLPVAAAEAPAWSPDGRRLAFVGGINRPGETDVTASEQVYVAGRDGAGARPLTHDRARKGGVAWSPDGRFIVFVRSAATGNRSSLWIVGSDGREARPLTRGATDLEPSWSPNGRAIVFLRVSPTYRSKVMVIRPDGSGLQRILAGFPNASEPVWSPNGKRLLLEDGRTLFTVRPDGRAKRTIARLASDRKGAIEDPRPSWSSGGRWVVFCQLRAGSLDRSDIWVVGADGKGLRRLTGSPGLDTDPSA